MTICYVCKTTILLVCGWINKRKKEKWLRQTWLKFPKLWKLSQCGIYKTVRDRKLKRLKTKDKDKWDFLYDEKCKVGFFPKIEPILLNKFINGPGKRGGGFKFQICSWNQKCQIYNNKLEKSCKLEWVRRKVAGEFQCEQE